MKTRILVATVLFCALFMAGGIYIALGISRGTAHLDRVIRMHQVELLREQLLYRVKMVQSGIKGKRTRFYRGVDAAISDVVKLDDALRGCLDCHHSPGGENRLAQLRNDVRSLEANISRMLTVRANDERLAAEEDRAWNSANDLIEEINGMIAATSDKLHRETRVVLEGIGRSNWILYGALALGPLLAVVFALTAIRWLVHPIEELARAARRWKTGEFGHRVPRLHHETCRVVLAPRGSRKPLSECLSAGAPRKILGPVPG